jgi:pilus assembly protein CpaF
MESSRFGPTPPAASAPLPWHAPADPNSNGDGPGRSGSRAKTIPIQEMKGKVHRKLVERLDLSHLDKVSKEELRTVVRKVVMELLSQQPVPLNVDERDQVVEQVLDEILGLGPLEPLMQDPDVSDILVNTYREVYVERRGKLDRTEVRFQDDQHLMQVIDRIVTGVGRRIDESSPMVDARLQDGSRINAVIPPLAIDGPHLSIRKFKRDALTAPDLVRLETITPAMVQLLQGIVKARMNIIISGGTGSGKTTMLNMLSSFIPGDERIITIEDSAELQLRQPHVVRMETRPANIEGQGEVAPRNLLVNALRMRPDRIIMGEVRGTEAVDMLQAMNTGHDGSLSTLHANTPRDAVARLETMIAMAGLPLPERAMRQQIASAVNVIIQMNRLSDGTRRVLTISEILGMEGDTVIMQDVFIFERLGITDSGRVVGRFRATGLRPRFAEAMRIRGIELPASLFQHQPDADASPW